MASTNNDPTYSTTAAPKPESSVTSIPQVLPNLMPCEIAPCEATVTKQLWSPQVSKETESDGSSQVTAYFRGRRLIGREFPLPEGYIGLIPETRAIEASPHQVRQLSTPGEDSEQEDEQGGTQAPLIRLDAKYGFFKMRILGHEETPSGDVAHVKAMQEWAKMAASIHQI